MPEIDPWPALEGLAAERSMDLTKLREYVHRVAASTAIIDPEQAIGNTVLLHLRMNRTLDEALDLRFAEGTAAARVTSKT